MALLRKASVPGTPGRLIKQPIRLGGPPAGVPGVPGGRAPVVRAPVARKPRRPVKPGL